MNFVRNKAYPIIRCPSANYFYLSKLFQKAEKIIFCGYSLPMAGYEFRYLLKQNIQPGTKIDVVLYHNDDPERSTDYNMMNYLPEKRYADLFSNCSCSFYYEGFGDYFQHKNHM